MTDKPEQVHPIKFDAIDADLVKRAAVRTRGRAEPSRLDSDGWRRILIINSSVSAPLIYVKPLLNSPRNCA